MKKPSHHFFVCCSFRASGEPQGVCHKKESPSLLPYLETELADRGIDAQVTSAGCLKVCDRGPALVVYPEAHWYGNITGPDAIDAILDALESGKECEEYALK